MAPLLGRVIYLLALLGRMICLLAQSLPEVVPGHLGVSLVNCQQVSWEYNTSKVQLHQKGCIYVSSRWFSWSQMFHSDACQPSPRRRWVKEWGKQNSAGVSGPPQYSRLPPPHFLNMSRACFNHHHRLHLHLPAFPWQMFFVYSNWEPQSSIGFSSVSLPPALLSRPISWTCHDWTTLAWSLWCISTRQPVSS